MTKIVKGEGPMDARIVIVGEAAGANEVEVGRPFVGAAGVMLDGMLREAGIERESCFVTNIMQVRPPKNDFSAFYVTRVEPMVSEKTGKILKRVKKTVERSPELVNGIERLHTELRAIRPNVIVTLGNEPLRAVTGRWGISHLRGYVIPTEFGKVVPTYHPSYLIRGNWDKRGIVVSDLVKAKVESEEREFKPIQRRIVICPSYEAIMQHLDEVRLAKRVAFDIEVETGQVNAIAFAVSPTWAISIPLWWRSGSMWSLEQEMLIWTRIKGILEDESIEKVAQNAQYDISVLRETLGIRVRGLVLDTMLGWHVLQPEMEKSLEFLGSVYTDQPPWKDGLSSEDPEVFWRYNGTDACVTWEIAREIEKELKEERLWEFYQDLPNKLVDPFIEMSLRGVRVDGEMVRRMKKEYGEKVDELKAKLAEQAGRVVNVGSPKDMAKWLYEELKLPVQYAVRKRDGGEKVKTPSTGEDALRTLQGKFDIPALDTVLAIRAKQKLVSGFLGMKVGRDGRVRCSFNIAGAETGRISSSKYHDGSGTNLQNIPKRKDKTIRKIFVPEPGHLFVQGDLSQAEARVVAALARCDDLLRLFEEGGDIHRRNASAIFGVPLEDVTPEQRDKGKFAVHSGNYGIGAEKFARSLHIPVPEARSLLNRYEMRYPELRRWRLEVEDRVRKTRRLITPLGRRREFHAPLTADLFRIAYAYVPQSTVADLLNIGLIRLAERLPCDCALLLQVHDSVLVDVPAHKAIEIAGLVRECLTVPFRVEGREVVIPVDVEVGDSWGSLVKVILDGSGKEIVDDGDEEVEGGGEGGGDEDGAELASES